MKTKEKINLEPFEPLFIKIIEYINTFLLKSLNVNDVRDSAEQFNLFNMCCTEVKDAIIDELCKRLIQINYTITDNEQNYYQNKYLF